MNYVTRRHHDEKKLLFWGMRKHGENIIGNRNYYCGYFRVFLIKGGYLPLIDDDSYFTTYNAWFLFFLSISFLFRSIIGGSTDQSFIYPIYVGLILLAGLVVGAAVVLYEEIEKLRKEVKSIREEEEKSKQE